MDFTEYGIPSADWVALEPSLPPVPAGLSVQQLKDVTNEGREKVSAEEMVSQGMFVHALHLKSRDWSPSVTSDETTTSCTLLTPRISTGLADAVTLTTHTIPTRDGSSIEARSYHPKSLTSSTGPLPVYVHLHGGGFLFGTLSSEDAACSRIVHSLTQQHHRSILVLNVNYRHTPEHTFPVAWEDVEDALVWLHSHHSENSLKSTFGAPLDLNKVIIGGISAGGQLSASTVLSQHLGEGRTAQLPKLLGQVLMIPALVHMEHYDGYRARLKSPDVSSLVTQLNAPVLDINRIRLFMKLLDIPAAQLSSEGFARDRRVNIGNATEEEIRGLPPSVFGVAGSDPLRDEGLLWAKGLNDAGYVVIFPLPVPLHISSNAILVFIVYVTFTDKCGRTRALSQSPNQRNSLQRRAARLKTVRRQACLGQQGVGCVHGRWNTVDIERAEGWGV